MYFILVLMGRYGGLSTLLFILSETCVNTVQFLFQIFTLTLFPIFWVKENWVLCYVTENLFKICYYTKYDT